MEKKVYNTWSLRAESIIRNNARFSRLKKFVTRSRNELPILGVTADRLK